MRIWAGRTAKFRGPKLAEMGKQTCFKAGQHSSKAQESRLESPGRANETHRALCGATKHLTGSLTTRNYRAAAGGGAPAAAIDECPRFFEMTAMLIFSIVGKRTKAGLAAARARGRNGGRPKVTSAETKVVLAKKLHADKSLEIDDVCKTLRISRSTFYRCVRLE